MSTREPQDVLGSDTQSVTVEESTGVLASDTLGVTVEDETGVIASDTLSVDVVEDSGVLASDTLNVTVEESGGVIAEDTLDVTVESAGGAEGTIVEFNAFEGPFRPGETHTIAEMAAQNTGDAVGTMNLQFAELDDSGNPVQIICDVTIDGVAPGAFFTLRRVTPGACLVDVTPNKEVEPIDVTLPDKPGLILNFGLKVWVENEEEPPFPQSPMQFRLEE